MDPGEPICGVKCSACKFSLPCCVAARNNNIPSSHVDLKIIIITINCGKKAFHPHPSTPVGLRSALACACSERNAAVMCGKHEARARRRITRPLLIDQHSAALAYSSTHIRINLRVYVYYMYSCA